MIKRHYTICSTMGDAVLDEIRKCEKSVLEGKPLDLIQKNLLSQDSSQINITLKDYHSVKGVATQLHNVTFDQESKEGDTKEVFMIKGPMGRGLQLSSGSVGHHFAFCAGTAVLIFLDIVSSLILKNTSEHANITIQE